MRVISKISWRAVRIISATLFCLVLFGALVRSDQMPVEAQPSLITIEATRTTNPYWGYYGGYHDIWAKIKPGLAAIGIDLVPDDYDDFSWWDQVWEDGWNETGDNTYPPGGWDVTMLEWWLQPHAVEPWFASMVLNEMTPDEGGFNIHPWMNEWADTLLKKALYSSDAGTRKYYFWEWQKEWIHDPPIAEIYYPRIFDLMGSYILGYDPCGCWWYDVSHLDINATKFEEEVGGGANPTRYAQGNDTIVYAVSEAVWKWSPMFMETYTEEQMASLVYDTLYVWTLNYTDQQWLTAGIVEPNPWDFIMRPDLASALPTYLDGGKRVRVPLRDNVTWSDGVPFNATDVKYTFDLTLNSATKNSGEGDFSYVIESVEYIPGTATDPYTGLENIDPYTVDFILKEPLPDIVSVLANDWGGSIMPWHSLNHLDPSDMRDDITSTDWTKMVPGTGSFNVTNYVTDEYITLERNDLYWGYDLGWGPHVNTIILKWVPDAKTRMTELQTNTVDFGEYPTGTVKEYHDLMNATNVRVFQYDYPAGNGVWFNFDNRVISNRYVRQAIAHAIPYETIWTGVFDSWGIETAYRGISHILPNNYYTDPDTGKRVRLFNEDLEPIVYDPIEAQMYMDMWNYSQVDADYTKIYPETHPYAKLPMSPVGDADFNGDVNMNDWWVWFRNFGKNSNQWPWIPGCDIDPDFNNDNATTMADFDRWSASFGMKYPFPGAR